ncbi:MAG TPA: hypothetical protein VFP47_00870 [Pyrinomonadaceae bacterium]|nr:hypothetical protein [Pyrinomonadaceae bacterium]
MRRSLISLVLLLAACLATPACTCPLDKDGVLRIGREVETQLPLGSTKDQVAKFLDDRHIDRRGHMEIMDTTKYNKLEQIMGSVYGGEPYGNLVFFFRDGKLVEWWVESGCGGGCYSMRANKSIYRPTGMHDCYDP